MLQDMLLVKTGSHQWASSFVCQRVCRLCANGRLLNTYLSRDVWVLKLGAQAFVIRHALHEGCSQRSVAFALVTAAILACKSVISGPGSQA